ncbi:MAG: hypothetical protein IK100_11925 [Muribaculaceae bacterium]|nr:hypothetical protein [Muribaculaceae bacterium]
MSNILITSFYNILDTEDQEGKKRVTIEYVINAIKTNVKISSMVDAIRSMHDAEQRKLAKRQLPVIMWQGLFSRRCNDGCNELSSLICIDIDHKSEEEIGIIKNVIAQWPYTCAVFRSPSGDGLKVVIKTDNYSIKDYPNCYRQVEQLFIDTFNITPDTNCEDVGRACYMSHDPDVYYNPSPLSWHYQYQPEFDKHEANPVTPSKGTYIAPDISQSQQFLNKLNVMRAPLSDEQIINILDLKFSRYLKNYEDGNRTKSIFVQAQIMCKAGINEEKAIDYIKSKFLPTGYNEKKLMWEVKQSYEKSMDLFGSERCNYKTFDEYKNSH